MRTMKPYNADYYAGLITGMERGERRAQQWGDQRCKGITPKQGNWPEHRCFRRGKYNGYCRQHVPERKPTPLMVTRAIAVLMRAGYNIGPKNDP